MRALLGKHGFGVVRDEDLHRIGVALSAETARATRVTMHLRIATADRLGPRAEGLQGEADAVSIEDYLDRYQLGRKPPDY